VVLAIRVTPSRYPFLSFSPLSLFLSLSLSLSFSYTRAEKQDSERGSDLSVSRLLPRLAENFSNERPAIIRTPTTD